MKSKNKRSVRGKVGVAKGFGPRHSENAKEGDQVSTDTVPAMLTPREAVLNRNAAELAGRQNIQQLNQEGNQLAEKGVDLAAKGQASVPKAVLPKVAGPAAAGEIMKYLQAGALRRAARGEVPKLAAEEGSEDVNMKSNQSKPKGYQGGIGAIRSQPLQAAPPAQTLPGRPNFTADSWLNPRTGQWQARRVQDQAPPQGPQYGATDPRAYGITGFPGGGATGGVFPGGGGPMWTDANQPRLGGGAPVMSDANQPLRTGGGFSGGPQPLLSPLTDANQQLRRMPSASFYPQQQRPLAAAYGASDVGGGGGDSGYLSNPEKAYGPPVNLSAPEILSHLQKAGKESGLNATQIAGLSKALSSLIGSGGGGGGAGSYYGSEGDAMSAAYSQLGAGYQGGISDIGYPPFVMGPGAEYHADKGSTWVGGFDPSYMIPRY